MAQEAGQAPVFKQEELDQILAPIALYPDSLVAQILMASTYPLEVVQADRFAKQNASLKGEALTKALEAQSWDPSVKSLVNFPQVLTMMSEKLEWTQKLGDAFLAQQKPVMDTIQSLRAKAQAAGNLKTTKEQTVIVEEKIIKIEPASPQVIYVPAYNPTVVYGAWPYPAYPPYSYYPPGYVATTVDVSFRPGGGRRGVGLCLGKLTTGTAEMSISMSIGTPTLITISTAAITSRTWRVTAKATGSTTRSIGKASRIEIRERRKNSTGQAHRKRLSHGRIFAAAPTLAGRIWRAAARAIAEEQVIAAAPANSAVATDRQAADRGGAGQLGGGQRDRGGAGIAAAQATRRVGGGADRGGAGIAAAQANSAVVVEQIEAALEAAAAPFKVSAAGEVRQGARVSAVARAVGRRRRRRWKIWGWWRGTIWRWRWRSPQVKKVSSTECRVKRSHVYFPVLTPDPRPPTLLTY